MDDDAHAAEPPPPQPGPESVPASPASPAAPSDGGAGETRRSDESEAGDEEGESEAASFWGELRSRMIVGAPMDAGVRITFLLGALTLLIAMGVDVIHDALGPPVQTMAGTFPLGALVVYAGGQFAIFTLYFSGLLQLKRRPRGVALAITALALFATPALQDFRAFDFLLVVPIAGLWLFAAGAERFGASASLKPAAATAACLSAVFVLAGLIGQDAILIELSGGAAILAAVGLFMASTDIAEIVQVAGDALAGPTRGWAPGLQAAAVCVAALITCTATGFILAAAGGVDGAAGLAQAFGSGLAPVVWFGLVYWMLVAVGRKRALVVRAHLPYVTLLAIVVFFGLAFYAGVLARFLADPSTYDAKQLLGYDQVKDVGILLFVLFTIALLTAGRRSAGHFMLFGLGCSVAVFWFIDFANAGATLVSTPFGVALGSILFLIVAFVWPKTRDRFAAVCGLLIATNLAFTGYTLLAALFLGGPSSLEEGSLLQALVVLVALGWDILTSGHVTLRESESVPRTARVAFFIAYISLVGLLVMMSSAASLVVPGTSTAATHVFESEGFVAVGLHLFGAPMLLFLFAIRMRNVLQAPA